MFKNQENGPLLLPSQAPAYGADRSTKSSRTRRKRAPYRRGAYLEESGTRRHNERCVLIALGGRCQGRS